MDRRPTILHPSTKKPFVSRRDFLFEAGEGMSGLALSWLLAQNGLLANDTGAPVNSNSCSVANDTESPLAPRDGHFQPRAKAVISLFMSGGVSHIDTFDP